MGNIQATREPGGRPYHLLERDLPGLQLTDCYHPPDFDIEKHSHEKPCIFMVMEGSATETVGGKTRQYDAFTTVLNPPDQVHSNHVLKAGARHFVLEIDNQWIDRLREASLKLPDSAVFRNGPLSWLMLRLQKESRQADEAAPLAIEGIALEIAAELSREMIDKSPKPPRWLEQAKELVRSDFLRRLTLIDIAQTVGIHPVHLARAFRRYYGCTVAEYIRQLRVEFASRQLCTSDASLAQIAFAAGFSDQSHFARVFKERMGATPAGFREEYRVNPILEKFD